MNRRATFVYPSGDPATAKLVIIGGQPGRREVVHKKPFVGPAGKVLDDCLHYVKILL